MIRNIELASRKNLSIEVVGVLYFAAVVIAGIILVCQPAKVAHMNQEVRRLNTQLHDLKLRNEDLKRMVATMESLTFIEAQARDNFGMVDPDQVKSVVVNIAPGEYEVAGEENSLNATEPAQGIFAWLNRIAQLMKDSIAVAKGRQ
ncbi:MAG TPA: hypothetical protein GX529_01050 [Firmicutes bacterium]|nr:hypothetical protein [Candidatus Fermentithermobacillaceae bacterium]